MEKTSFNTKQSSFVLLELPLHVLIYTVIIRLVIGIERFFSKFESQLECDEFKTWEEKRSADLDDTRCFEKHRDGDGRLCVEEVETVMRRLGLFCRKEIEEGEEEDEEEGLECSEEELLGIFESKEPSLEEVKESFDVFDLNRDGFIDAVELQRVLCSLGLKEGLEIENCRRMIKTYDENGDGLIDFKEFLRFMERSFC